MSVDFAVGQIKRYTEEKKIVWYMQYDGTLEAAYAVNNNQLALTLRKNHEQLVILSIALSNIMRTDIIQGNAVIWKGSPLDRLIKNFGIETKTPASSPETKLIYEMEALYEVALKSAIKPEQTREILLKMISGF